MFVMVTHLQWSHDGSLVPQCSTAVSRAQDNRDRNKNIVYLYKYKTGIFS